MITWKLLRSFALFLALAATASAARFVAYSMREAENRLRQSAVRSGELVELGGITRLAGMVYDSATKDWIVVGQVGKGQKTSLDQLVVALRSVVVHKTWPAVSIDKTPDSDKTRLQSVRFEGGIANTAFGQQFLEADVVLKKLALGYLRSDVWGVPSYFDLSAERLRQTGVEEVVSSRFWFDIVGECLLAQREGVAAIGELRLGVLPQVLSMNGKPVNRRLRGPRRTSRSVCRCPYRQLPGSQPVLPRSGQAQSPVRFPGPGARHPEPGFRSRPPVLAERLCRHPGPDAQDL